MTERQAADDRQAQAADEMKLQKTELYRQIGELGQAVRAEVARIKVH